MEKYGIVPTNTGYCIKGFSLLGFNIESVGGRPKRHRIVWDGSTMCSTLTIQIQRRARAVLCADHRALFDTLRNNGFSQIKFADPHFMTIGIDFAKAGVAYLIRRDYYDDSTTYEVSDGLTKRSSTLAEMWTLATKTAATEPVAPIKVTTEPVAPIKVTTEPVAPTELDNTAAIAAIDTMISQLNEAKRVLEQAERIRSQLAEYKATVSSWLN
jgi:hypothetical protein